MVRTFSWVSTRINLADGDRSARSGEYVHDCITQIDVRWARTHEKVHVLITQMVTDEHVMVSTWTMVSLRMMSGEYMYDYIT